MDSRLVRSLLVCCLAVAALAVACGEPAWEKNGGRDGGDEAFTSSETPANALSDQWYDRMRDGQKAGWAHVVWTPSEFEGRPTIHDHTEFYAATTRLMGGVQDRFVSRTLIDVEREADGSLLWMREVGLQAGRKRVAETRWTGTGYAIVETVAGLEERRFVPSPAPVPTDTEAFLSARIVRGEVAPGQSYRIGAVNPQSEEIDTLELEIGELETLALPTGPAACFRVTERVEGRPFEATWWIDLKGVLRRQVRETTELISTTQERARDMPRHGVTYSITVPADPYLPRCTDLERALIEVSLAPRAGTLLPDFPRTPFSREVSRKDHTIVLELRSHDAPDATIELPVTDVELAPWLRSTNLLSAAAPGVQAALREAIGNETDGRTVALRLLEYVQRTLEKRSGPIPSPTAVEILRDGCGDCSEHNVLFVALCRAAGLPARRLSGYAQVGEVWGMHAFAEVWLGEWIGADPTTNELGTSARYIAFGWEDDADSFPAIVSGAAERTASYDPLSGLTLAAAPEGWWARVHAVPGRAGIEGPGVSCEVSVSSGPGNLPVSLLRDLYLPYAEEIEFAGRAAALTVFDGDNHASVTYMIPFRRRTLQVNAQLSRGTREADIRPILERLLAPTLR